MSEAYSFFLMQMSDMYRDESFYSEGFDLLDFADLQGTACYCDGEAARIIEERVAGLPSLSVRWIDTGDYHYLSCLWMHQVREPFVLLLFDNHPDDQPGAFGDDMLSCGSWVMHARRDCSMLQDVVWIRKPSDIDRIEDVIMSGLPVYLSIDKDVLDRSEYRTDWDQGSLTMDMLKDALSRLHDGNVRMTGIDVCGGITRSQGASDEDLAVNRAADYELMNLLLIFTR